METPLYTLSTIFTERLFRIPDYQRGYAWTEKQVKEFWTDIDQIQHESTHYTGVLTLEAVPHEQYERWDDDLWIIAARNFKPYFVVDGQQRLTTAIIMLQVILECVGTEEKLNFTEQRDIRKKFIYESKDEGVSRSFLFGYEKDNPSYEFLKTKIFGVGSLENTDELTIYTQNLENAKAFFRERITQVDAESLEVLYRKLTQQLVFNLFSISHEVDVCVAFETMNNRGKPLSNLELLKNRLIYLSMKFPSEFHDRNKLRSDINACWKTLYHNLGRNPKKPLDDDHFLFSHYILYHWDELSSSIDTRVWGSGRQLMSNIDYSTDLLEKRFVSKNLLTSRSNPRASEPEMTVKDVSKYVSSLGQSIDLWYKIWNPLDSNFQTDLIFWLDKINRIDMRSGATTLLAFFQRFRKNEDRLNFLKAFERYSFIRIFASSYFGVPSYFDTEVFSICGGLSDPKEPVKRLADISETIVTSTWFRKDLLARFSKNGFYDWHGIRYLLFEYNLDLQSKTKSEHAKLSWEELSKNTKDFVTVEHIFPQKSKHAYWSQHFKGLGSNQRRSLRNSLGNLLPLSRAKNSSLSNKPFPEKVSGKKNEHVGYRYGCYAENEVAAFTDWTPAIILERGLKMLDFVEKRWSIPLGNKSEKTKLLGLSFIETRKKKQQAKKSG